ncbi:MAG: Gfo/Idh/MocA family oxidoreductase [Isosphaeraceae bacterium]
MIRRANRRTFLMQSVAVSTGLAGKLMARPSDRGANEKIRIAIVGAGGMGRSHVEDPHVKNEQVVALCDIDENRLASAAKVHPAARTFHDFRKMFDAMEKDIDAVICATPDHTHAVVTARALRAGKHVYTQKPLTHTVYEARVIADLARSNPRLATQMGNQGHSNQGAREVVEIVRSGVVGPIREVHAWTDRPIWPQAIDRPAGGQDPPGHIHWDLWLGPMPARPYHEGTYHPFNWRGWWDFGTGALGDMACHVVDTAFWALDLRHPSRIKAECEGARPETGPKWSIITYEFPARGTMPPVTFTWYDGGKFPPRKFIETYGLTSEKQVREGDKTRTVREPGFTANGSLLVGEKGIIHLDDAYGSHYRLYPEKDFRDFKAPSSSIPRSPGHMLDWITAIKTGGQACSNFEYATALTGMVLLGNLALRAGKAIDWDPRELRATNGVDVANLVQPAYRPGWEL